MWCKNCNKEINDPVCPYCGASTEEDIPVEVYWCPKCKTPIIKYANSPDKAVCSICKSSTTYLAADIRPVFPEERLLVEILLDKPLEFLGKSVWASNNRYYIDGKTVTISASLYHKYSPDYIIEQLEKYKPSNQTAYFEQNIELFVIANADRLNYIKDEAYSFIQNAASKFDHESIVLSFSGGKDSTVTADLAVRALSDPSLVHIFGNTTLEFPLTIEYAERFRINNPKAIFKIAKNKEQDFYSVCYDIGPPARMMRWCCSMFKTGPITRVINSMFREQNILTFYGIRKCESVSRSKYNRIEDSAESVKIQKQTVASPIFLWKDIDIWLYILAEKIDFNEAYRLGYDRVGCWCCPNNNARAQFLSSIYMPEQSKKWREYLISFAKQIGKPDPEVYIDSGKWKARQGGNGLAAAQDVKIKFSNCTSEEHAKIYRLNKPVDDAFISLFNPFGRIAPELGRKLIKETIVVDVRTNVPLLSIQPFDKDGFEYSVKIKTMNVANHDDLQRMVGYQIKKYNACRKCLKCESLCRFGAITITADEYRISEKKCKKCKMCVTAKYLNGGCLMDRYLRTKD
ncbi:MAG: phosphoadenosine phosphosulfate reductase [Clostridia bacterium]|nr:phosphoadenosine phosphosulfate reductase [Clostridia bacterium]